MQILSCCPHLGAFLASLPTRFRRLVAEMRRDSHGASYRPERHYMRGPGPKSRVKARHGNPNSGAA